MTNETMEFNTDNETDNQITITETILMRSFQYASNLVDEYKGIAWSIEAVTDSFNDHTQGYRTSYERRDANRAHFEKLVSVERYLESRQKEINRYREQLQETLDNLDSRV